MLKKIDMLLNIIIGCTVGVLIGYSVYEFLYYKAHPEMYEIMSAPWYTGVIIYGAAAGVIIIIAVILKLIIWHKIK